MRGGETLTIFMFFGLNLALILTETVNSFRAISENQYKHILCETKHKRLDKIRCVIGSVTFEAIT